jgi:hypothetical protein
MERVEFCCRDGFLSPFPEQSFDAVYCMNNIGFRYAPDSEDVLRGYMQNIGAMIKEGGYLFLSAGKDAVILQRKKIFRETWSSRTFGEIKNLASLLN